MNPSRILTSMGKRFQGEKGVALGVAGALVLSYPLLLVSALWPNALLFAVFALVGYVTEAMVVGRAGQFSAVLNQVGLSATLRAVFRETALLLLLARDDSLSSGWFSAAAAAVVLLHALRAVHSSAALKVIGARTLPVLTRGFDLSRLRIPPPPPVFVRRHRDLLNLDVALVAAGPVSIAVGAAWPMAAALAVTAVAWLGALVLTARQVRRNRHLADRDQVLKLVAEEVAAYGPEVVLYFSGAEDCMYQINMWLETFDRLDRRNMIILRERANLPLLGRTSAPVLCFPVGTEMMNFPMPESTRVALFPANAGPNIHMLRLPQVRSVFIGHGDSDKAASFSPFSKVYDQVWVAGPVGRERYLRSEAGVRDEDIVEVGRPQLAPIDTTGVTPDPMFTVLYAPTWEGWTGDKFHTSVAVMGPKLVRLLLDHAPHVRLLYKPHPMAGKDDPAVRRAHQKIVKMIAEANATRDARGEWSADPARVAAARSRLEELTAKLAGPGGDAAELDEAEASRAAAVPDLAGKAVWRETLAAAEQTYWEAEGWWRHRVITGPVPHLYSCFNRADLLITDISSVVTDFIASGKPYVVTNGADVPDEEFRRNNPSTSAAYLLGRDCSGLAGILAAVSADGEDAMAPRRRELKRHLLGAESDSMALFARAVDALMKERARPGARS
jgi:hypothetical protein